MRKQAYTMIAMIVLVGSMAVAAQAQTGRTQLVANIPFQFNVGDRIMPAGEYVLRSTSDNASDVLVRIQSQDGKASAMLQMMTVTGKAQESSKLIFNRYGNHYFLAGAWVDGENSGLQALKSRGERATARELAGIRVNAESIALAARR